MTYTLDTLKSDFLLEGGINHYAFLNELRVLTGIPKSEIPDFGEVSEVRNRMRDVLSDSVKAGINKSFYNTHYNSVNVGDGFLEFDLLVWGGATLGVYINNQWLLKCPDTDSTQNLEDFSAPLYQYTQGELNLKAMGYDLDIYRRK